jgi:phosphotransferase system enzyme I (PtsI)
MDRIDDHVNYLYDPLHPAVLRLIHLTIMAGKSCGIPVSMCGEMAGDPRYTRLLLAMGLDHFSMHPNGLLDVKRVITETNLTELPDPTLDMLNKPTVLDSDLLLEQINSA